ncbi:4-hydroxyproline epimerase [compost metagenome]
MEGEAFHHESIIGSRFTGRVEATTKLSNGMQAVYPSIEGSAWITGRAEFYVDDQQPYSNGFSLNEFCGPRTA